MDEKKYKVVILGCGQMGAFYDFDHSNTHPPLSHLRAFYSHKNFEVLGGDLEFGHVGDNTSAEKRLGVRTDEPNQTQSSLHIEGGQATYSNRAGGHLRLKAGGGSGTGNSGEISFFTCTGSLSSGEENTVLERARFTPNGELGIGTNPSAREIGHVENKFRLGTAHIALGDNHLIGWV